MLTYHAFLEDKNHLALMFAQDVRPTLYSHLTRSPHVATEAWVVAKVCKLHEQILPGF